MYRKKDVIPIWLQKVEIYLTPIVKSCQQQMFYNLTCDVLQSALAICVDIHNTELLVGPDGRFSKNWYRLSHPRNNA